MEIAFPFYINQDGLIGSITYDEHIQQMILQLIFTSPGERVNRPELGCGLDRLVFAPAGNEMVTATQSLVQSELQRWLGDVIRVEAVKVKMEDTTLLVTIQYVVLRSGQRCVHQFKQCA